MVIIHYGGDLDDRRSFTGYAFTLNGGVVTWDSKKKKTTAVSTEAEYMALSDAAKEAVHLQRFLKELGVSNLEPPVLYNDNRSAQMLASNTVFHSRTKHIDIRYHFVRQIVESGALTLDHIPTEKMPADVLTKGLSKPKHTNCINLLGLEMINN